MATIKPPPVIAGAARQPAIRNQECFTLIELLVVVAIIAVLVAILLPALNSAREQARTAICSARIRTIGLAMTYYTEDYNEHFPWNRNSHPQSNWIQWYYMLGPSSYNSVAYGAPAWLDRGTDKWREFFTCPTEEAMQQVFNDFTYVANFWVLTSSGVNGPNGRTDILPHPQDNYMNADGYWSFKKSAWSNPARAPMMMDGQVSYGPYLHLLSLYSAIQPATVSGYANWHRIGFMEQIGQMHQGGGNFCFLDLHVEKVPYRKGPAGKEWTWYKYAFNWLPDGIPVSGD